MRPAPVPAVLCSRSAACKAQLKQATELYQARRYAEALLAFQGVYARWPEARLLLNIGRTLQKLGHLKGALDYFRRCQELNREFRERSAQRREHVSKQESLERAPEAKSSC